MSIPSTCVVAPVDFSPESFEAVATALSLADNPQSVRVVHVLPPGEEDEYDSVWSPLDPDTRIEETRQALSEKLQEHLHAELEPHVLIGEPATEIAAFAQSQQADLVVIPSQGRTGWLRWLQPSTSEQVVRLCHCPVLVLRK